MMEWLASESTAPVRRTRCQMWPDLGKCRFRPADRYNHLWLTTRAAAVNLVRLTNLGVTHNNGAFTL